MKVAQNRKGEMFLEFHKGDVAILKRAQGLLELFVRTEDPDAKDDFKLTPEKMTDGQLAARGAALMGSMIQRRGGSYVDRDGNWKPAKAKAASDGKKV
jgi:hypothetical protein